MDEKQKEIKTKSASGIWAWIFCLLFASAVIVVVIGAFGNYIWHVLTGKPDPGAVYPEEGGPMGVVRIRDDDTRHPRSDTRHPRSDTIPPGSNTW